jgi:cell division inhibitor SepF
MALRDTWHRALVYFGLAEDPDYHEPEGDFEADTGAHAEPYEASPRGGRSATVSRLGDRRRARDEIDDIFADEPGTDRTRTLRPVEGNGGADVSVHLVTPSSFNNAQEVADRFKQGVPVILNLQTTEGELAKRLIDFASGMTYALDGGMQKVADKTFLLTPRNVEVSAEEQARLVEKGFFNQS